MALRDALPSAPPAHLAGHEAFKEAFDMRQSIRFLFASAALTLLALLAPAAHAQSTTKTFTCGRDFAQIGETKSVVQAKCGRPASTDSFCKPIAGLIEPEHVVPGDPGRHAVRRADGRVYVVPNACDQVEEWTYRPGAGQFITILQFRAGALDEIRYGPRQ
jgi:hypothetical protein